jgi:NifU-like protein involved in Fe-S cluster formation
MDFAKFQRLVEEREGFRTMEAPSASGEYFSDSCGDLYTFYLLVGPGEVIEDISYFTTGCGFGTATSSLLVGLTRGKTLVEAEAVSEQAVMDALGGYPEKKRDYPARSIAALHAAIADYRTRRARGEITDAMLDAAHVRGEALRAHSAAKAEGAEPQATEPVVISLR